MPTSPRRPSPQFPQQDTAGASRATRAPGAEVLILGVTASGKTTFLTVLGHKFASSGVFNLGLTEVPGTGTLRFVDESWHRMTAPLAERDFPPATDPGEEAANLSWDVDVGDQTLFRLSTFDCAGEIIYSVFTQNPEEDGSPALGETSQERKLRSLAKRAKVLCLFLRPGDLEAGQQTDATSAARERARKTKETLLAVARGPISEEKKLLFVLTDSHAYEEELARQGGPASWLFNQIPALKRTPRARNAMVLATSAVNETVKRSFRDTNGASRVREVPAANFTSTGLETFLLGVGGMVSQKLRPLGERMLALQKAQQLWTREKQSPNPASVGDRFRLSQNFADAAAEFQREAEDVLSKSSPDSIIRDTTQRFIQNATLEARRTDVLEKTLQEMLNECVKKDVAILRDESWWEKVRALVLENAEVHRPGGAPYDRTELPEASVWYISALEEARHRCEEEKRREEERLKEEEKLRHKAERKEKERIEKELREEKARKAEKLRRVFITVFLLVAAVAVIGAVGVSCQKKLERKKAAWRPGEQRGGCVAGTWEEGWKARPGWEKTSSNKRNPTATWRPGTSWPGNDNWSANENIVASHKEDTWESAPGYVEVDSGNLLAGVRWSPGSTWPEDSHIIALEEEGSWGTAPGYVFVDDSNFKAGTRWNPGIQHSKYLHVIASNVEGNWVPEGGFAWKRVRKGQGKYSERRSSESLETRKQNWFERHF